jgi:uncharacterized protein involved in exopolysaccharide biosynthesis
MKNKNGKINGNEKYYSISPLDLILVISERIKANIVLVGIAILLGSGLAILKDDFYTAESKIVADLMDSQGLQSLNNISSLRSFGINLSTSSSSFIPDTYPEIFMSKDVLYKVIKTNFYHPDMDSTISFEDYYQLKSFKDHILNYTVKLPFVIIKNISKKSEKSTMRLDENILHINEKEAKAINRLRSNISVVHDFETGVITIKTKSNEPFISAQLNHTLILNFQNTVRQIYDDRNLEQLEFIEEQVKNAEKSLNLAEANLVNFLERNTNPTDIQLKVQLDKLKRELEFRENIFKELLLQFNKTKIELIKNEPLLKVFEKPSPPIEKSGFGSISILIIFFLIGIIIVFIKSLVIILRQILDQNVDTATKLHKIKINLSSVKKSISKT